MWRTIQQIPAVGSRGSAEVARMARETTTFTKYYGLISFITKHSSFKREFLFSVIVLETMNLAHSANESLTSFVYTFDHPIENTHLWNNCQ